jgi:hypothetical protein
LVFYGFRWYSMGFVGICWRYMEFSSVRGYSLVFDGFGDGVLCEYGVMTWGREPPAPSARRSLHNSGAGAPRRPHVEF